MFDIREIDADYSVSGQIAVEDLERIKALGFRSVVCNRPDDEEPGQLPFAAIAARAAELGLETAHVPVGRMGVDGEAVAGMVDALDELPRPIFAYCRSGARSAAIYEKSLHMRG